MLTARHECSLMPWAWEKMVSLGHYPVGIVLIRRVIMLRLKVDVGGANNAYACQLTRKLDQPQQFAWSCQINNM